MPMRKLQKILNKNSEIAKNSVTCSNFLELSLPKQNEWKRYRSKPDQIIFVHHFIQHGMI